jgi:hypothetical protein
MSLPFETSVRVRFELLYKTSEDSFSAPLFYTELQQILIDILHHKYCFQPDSPVSDSDLVCRCCETMDNHTSKQIKALFTTFQLVKFAGFRPDVFRAFEDLGIAHGIADNLLNAETSSNLAP